MATVPSAAQAAYHLPTFLADVTELLRRRGIVATGPVDPTDAAQRHARGLLQSLGVRPVSRMGLPRPRRTDPIPPELFETSRMRSALAHRDIAAVFKRLSLDNDQSHGQTTVKQS